MRIHNALPCLFSLGLATALIAPAGAADLSVKGSIAPQACTLNIVQGADLSLGEIDILSLPESNGKELPMQTVSMEVNCDHRSSFGLSFADLTDSEKSDNPEFYLVSNDDTKLGWFGARIANIVVDGKSAVSRPIYMNKLGGKEATYIVKSRKEGYLMVFEGGRAAKSTSFNMNITPNLVAGSQFDKANVTSLRGGMTIELAYR